MAGQQLGSMGNNEASNHCLLQSLGIDKQMAAGLPQCQFLLQQMGALAQPVKAALGEAQWRPQRSRASRLQAGTATPRPIQALATPLATGGREQATSISPMRTGKGLSGKKHKSTVKTWGWRAHRQQLSITPCSQGGAINMIYPSTQGEGLQVVAQELRMEVLEKHDLDEARALGPNQLNTQCGLHQPGVAQPTANLHHFPTLETRTSLRPPCPGSGWQLMWHS